MGYQRRIATLRSEGLGGSLPDSFDRSLVRLRPFRDYLDGHNENPETYDMCSSDCPEGMRCWVYESGGSAREIRMRCRLGGWWSSR